MQARGEESEKKEIKIHLAYTFASNTGCRILFYPSEKY
ncbi:hypothetical protein PLG01_01310 [Streptococcus mutans PKUSS-LG01]|nr:hypothetical protein PLG01_01310 [Streptococcus mutans PKUSS-LG01]